jgi:hypothetical protein
MRKNPFTREKTGTSVARLAWMQVALRPYFRRRYLLTNSERHFYEMLRGVVRDHLILAKVRLADLVDADERHPRWQANFNRVCSKHIAFVICDALFRPIIAVELDGSSHEREDRRKRDRERIAAASPCFCSESVRSRTDFPLAVGEVEV